MHARASCAGLLLTLLLGCSELPTEPSREGRLGSSSISVIGGTNDTTHDAVVAIATNSPAAPMASFCSATVIAKRALLTAAHCVYGIDPMYLSVDVGPVSRFPTSTLAVTEIHTHPSYLGHMLEDAQAGHDIAVVFVDGDLAPAPVAIAHAAPAIPSTATLVGYGMTNGSDLETRGTRRVADVSLSATCSSLVQFGDETTNACHGDSGAPLLRHGASGDEIVGVVSYGATDGCSPPSFATRVDAYADWIGAVIAGGSDAATMPTSSDCPPSAGDAAVDAAPDAPIDSAFDGAVAGDAAVASDASSSVAARGGGCSMNGHERTNPALAYASMFALALASRRRMFRNRTRRSTERSIDERA